MHKKNFGAKIIHFFKFSNIFTKKSKIYLCNPLQITEIVIRNTFSSRRETQRFLLPLTRNARMSVSVWIAFFFHIVQGFYRPFRLVAGII